MMVRRVQGAFTIARYGLLILRWCGLSLFVKKLAHQLYGHATFYVERNPIDAPSPVSSFKCTVRKATFNDVEKLFSELPHESREGRYELLGRKWYHEIGFGDCYVARANDTGEICHVRWLVTATHIKQLGWQYRFPLTEDEVMLENSYTLEKYRRQGVKTACLPQLRAIARDLGYTHSKGYVNTANIPQLLSDQKDGDMISARVSERHILFRVTRKTLERYDPPIPVIVPPHVK